MMRWEDYYDGGIVAFHLGLHYLLFAKVPGHGSKD